MLAPASDTIGVEAAGGDGQSSRDAHSDTAIAATIDTLVQLQRRRRFLIKEVNGSVSRIDHLLAGAVGHDGTMGSKKKAFGAASTYRLAVERDGEGHSSTANQLSGALSVFDDMILRSAAAREGWQTLRKTVEREMETIAKPVPGAAFVASVRGLSWLGFAVIQAEAGAPIGAYRSVAGLWKRMGLAVIDGRRQRGVSGKRADDAEARKLFHPKERRGEIYAFLQDTMFRGQWRGARLDCSACPKPTKFRLVDDAPICAGCERVATVADIIPAHPAGPYGEVYQHRRRHTAPRAAATARLAAGDRAKWSPLRCKNDATRVMAKAVLRDLWRACRGLPPRQLEPVISEADGALDDASLLIDDLETA